MSAPLRCRPTLGNLLSSSMREMMFMGLLAIMSRASWLSVNSMCSQSMLSRSYSSCSSLNTCRTKNCCRCSLAKLMHSCSKLQGGVQGTGGSGRQGDVQALPCRSGAGPSLVCSVPLGLPISEVNQHCKSTPSITEEDTEAQRGHNRCPRSLSESEGELRLEPSSLHDQALREGWWMGTTPLAEHLGEEEPRHWGGASKRDPKRQQTWEAGS